MAATLECNSQRAAPVIAACSTVASWNSAITSCGRQGRVAEARALFDSVPARTIVSWNAIIAAYAQNGHPEPAFHLFQEALETPEGACRPDRITFVNVLQACNSLGRGKAVHANVLERGFEQNVIVGTALVKMYGKCGSLAEATGVFDKTPHQDVFSWNALISVFARNGRLDEARGLFNRMPQRDVVSWNCMIAAYAQIGQHQQAIELFNEMSMDTARPDKITFLSTLDACSSQASLKAGKAMHVRIASSGFEPDSIIRCALVNMYGKCGSPECARKVFDRASSERDMVLWTSAINAYSRNGKGMEALELFRLMMHHKGGGMKPNEITFVSLLDACAGLEALHHGKMIHACISSLGLELQVVVGNALVNMYGKCRRVEQARAVFDGISPQDVISQTSMITAYGLSGRLEDARSVLVKMPERSSFAWNAMISAYAQNGQPETALGLFHQMNMEGLTIDRVTFISVLDACASLADSRLGKEVHAGLTSHGFEPDTVVDNALINMYGKCGNPVNARRVFNKMVRWDLLSWNAVITAYAQNKQGKQALQLFQQMVAKDVKPSKTTYVSVLDACASMSALEQGRKAHDSIVRSGFEVDVVVGNALIHMYGKCGSPRDARSVFDEMGERDVVSWTALVAAYAQSGQGMEAFRLLREMAKEGVKPNKITFIAVMSGCSHAGLPDFAWNCFASMCQDHDITPTVEHYVCMIDVFGRAGRLDEAEDLIVRSMPMDAPFEPHALAWTCLLNACRVHGDLERASNVAEHLFELNPKGAVHQCIAFKHTRIGHTWDNMTNTRERVAIER